MVLVETDGYTEVEAPHQTARIIDIFGKNCVTDIQIASNAEGTEQLWKARKSVGSVTGKLLPDSVSKDVTIPISKVGDFLKSTSSIIRKHNLPFVIFGNAGDGRVHLKIMYDRYQSDEFKQIDKTLDEIFKLACDLGGTLIDEHGIGLCNAHYMTLKHDPVAMESVRSIRKIFDTNNILNPGKMALARWEDSS
jgi:glycolate oxidase